MRAAGTGIETCFSGRSLRCPSRALRIVAGLPISSCHFLGRAFGRRAYGHAARHRSHYATRGEQFSRQNAIYHVFGGGGSWGWRRPWRIFAVLNKIPESGSDRCAWGVTSEIASLVSWSGVGVKGGSQASQIPNQMRAMPTLCHGCKEVAKRWADPDSGSNVS